MSDTPYPAARALAGSAAALAAARAAAAPAGGRSRRRDRRGSACRSGTVLTPSSTRSMHLLGGDRGGNQMRRRRIVLEAFEAARQPCRHAGAGTDGKARDLLEVVDRHDARRDRHPDAGRARALEKAQVVRVVEAELGDDAIGAGVDLGLEVVDVGRRASGSRGASRDSRRPRSRRARSSSGRQRDRRH